VKARAGQMKAQVSLLSFPVLTTKFRPCSSANETSGELGRAGRTFCSFTVILLYTGLPLTPLKSAVKPT